MTGDQSAFLRLASGLAEMSRLLDEEDYEATAHRFVQHLVHAVPGCDLAFIAVSREDGVELVTSTGRPLDAADRDDAEHHGPVAEVLRYGEPRRLEDTREDRRWPLFASRLALNGFRSCLVLPVPTERSPAAAVALLSRAPHRFDDHAYDLVLLVTLHTGIVLDNIQVLHHSKQMIGHLTTALGTRHTIGLAQGLLMHHFSHDTATSFALLRRASQHANRKLRDVAAELVSAHERGELHDALARHRIDPAPRYSG
ncbi:GAF and ANTAR domain-containing protein [Saccharothrix sp. Mg75]|uniref:GAF and ANTAR domain-containing protein n=1 Tax=Saccharothrix sp. Mg75 TaxID=3445357 RepID=UPI003EE912E1